MIEPLPDLSRTRDAIARYDTLDATLVVNTKADLSLLERAAEEVGEAFGLDTADRNSPERCRELIRPGPKVPGPGADLSFVRRMVLEWEEQH